MATKDDKKNVGVKATTELSVQSQQQPEGTGGEQLPPQSGVLQTSTTGDTGTAATDDNQQPNDPGNAQQTTDPNLVGDADASAPGAAIQPESAGVVDQPEFIPQPVRVTVQAVAVPNKRRMRAGHLFTEEPQTFVREDFTDAEWELIDKDPHLKIRRLED